jgi:SSS family solute:Na+ symporter
VNLGVFDYLWIVAYLAAVLGVGWFLKRRTQTSGDFFLAGRSIPAWAAALAFISANCGATEMVGIAACGAKYGMLTSHFYWLGAIPAMVFLGLFMMPFYYGSKARSVPEYSLTPRIKDDATARWYSRPATLAIIVLAVAVALNVIFW